MKKTECAINIVGTEGAIGKEKEWHKWYNEKHIPDIMKFPGVKKVSRYQKVSDNGKVSYPEYLAIYEFESPEAAEAYEKSAIHDAVVEDSAKMWGKGGSRQTWRAQYKCIMTVEK